MYFILLFEWICYETYLCSTESMAALCEWAFVEPEDRAAFLIKIGIMHVVRETETRERGTQEAEEALRNELPAACWIFA